MSESDRDTDLHRTHSDHRSPRYASMCIDDASCVVYDTENHDAWIQASNAVSREAVR